MLKYNKIFTRSLFCVQFILFRYQITNSQTLHKFDHIFYRHVKFSINQCRFMSGSHSTPFCTPVNKVKIISGGGCVTSRQPPPTLCAHVNKVNKVKIMSGCVCVWEGVMSRSDSSPFCIPVNKVKIIAGGGYVWK